MHNDKIINQLTPLVRKHFEGAEAGHDWWHTYRVWRTALRLCEDEQNADRYVVSLAALLHDIADPKFHGGDEEIGPKTASSLMNRINVDKATADHVINIIRHMSFKNSFEEPHFDSLEMRIVQDADRLDAMGAIGIARAFNYGGYKNHPFYDPDIQPDLEMTKEQYQKKAAPTINHFYVKLLRLKDMMHTDRAKVLAKERHDFMERYLQRFYKEWEGS